MRAQCRQSSRRARACMQTHAHTYANTHTSSVATSVKMASTFARVLDSLGCRAVAMACASSSPNQRLSSTLGNPPCAFRHTGVCNYHIGWPCKARDIATQISIRTCQAVSYADESREQMLDPNTQQEESKGEHTQQEESKRGWGIGYKQTGHAVGGTNKRQCAGYLRLIAYQSSSS